jgi:methionyl-tRNA formyltransferase
MSHVLRLVMLGTGPFAVPTFEALLGEGASRGYQTVALVTRPQRAARDRYSNTASPMRAMAEKHENIILDPEDINSPEARLVLADLAADLLVVCDYGQILSRDTLATARLGGINLHGSLLPKYRGAAPVNWAIFHGETETGVTVIHMTPKLDAGPCIAQARTPIGSDETAIDLEPRLARLGAPLVLQSIDDLAAGRAKAIPQDPGQATLAPRLKKADGILDWSRPAVALRNQIRAFQPWPRSFTTWQQPGGQPVRLIIDRAAVEPSVAALPPGTIVTADRARLAVATGEGQLVIEQVQPAGKRVMTAEEFLRGHAVQVGDRLG